MNSPGTTPEAFGHSDGYSLLMCAFCDFSPLQPFAKVGDYRKSNEFWYYTSWHPQISIRDCATFGVSTWLYILGADRVKSRGAYDGWWPAWLMMVKIGQYLLMVVSKCSTRVRTSWGSLLISWLTNYLTILISTTTGSYPRYKPSSLPTRGPHHVLVHDGWVLFLMVMLSSGSR